MRYANVKDAPREDNSFQDGKSMKFAKMFRSSGSIPELFKGSVPRLVSGEASRDIFLNLSFEVILQFLVEFPL